MHAGKTFYFRLDRVVLFFCCFFIRILRNNDRAEKEKKSKFTRELQCYPCGLSVSGKKKRAERTQNRRVCDNFCITLSRSQHDNITNTTAV